MPRTKRHYKGNNKSNDRKRRRENEERWKSTTNSESNKQCMENRKFDAFYKAQRILVDENDWNNFKASLLTPLPACFRTNPDYEFIDELTKELHGFVGETLKIGEKEIQAVSKMSWYESGDAYKLGTCRRTIRKSDALEPLHKWMIQHTDCGNITRQEAVSMVPPIALNVQPHHKCLDMCAAPGSKTSQLLEIVNRSLGEPESQQGLVVANDSDTDRAYMLVHQCRRLNSPLLLVTTHKGQEFPRLTPADTAGDAATSAGGISTKSSKRKEGYFDRVLCDVPCSGDGTLRKSPNIWGSWLVGSGVALHPLQLMIAQRGLLVLRSGGLMVYSTCSMSPYEDEAVVAELLRSNKGTLELVDARAEFLPKFKCRRGISTWHVLDDKPAYKDRGNNNNNNNNKKNNNNNNSNSTKDVSVAAVEEAGNMSSDASERSTEKPAPLSTSDPYLLACMELGIRYFPNKESVSESDVFEKKRIRASLFPPTEEEKEWMHLDRCMRCVPHDEDTGGFFVATLRKIHPSDDKAVTVSNNAESKASEELEDMAELEMAVAMDTTDVVEDDADIQLEEEAGEGGVPCKGGAAETRSEKTEVEGGEGRDVVTNKNEKGEGTSRGGGGTKGLTEYQPWNLEDYTKVASFYGFGAALVPEAFFVREDVLGGGKNGRVVQSKSIYFIPYSVRALMAGDKEEKLKLVSAGIKVLDKNTRSGSGVGGGDCDYRLLQDGIQLLEPHMSSERKISVTIQDFCNILGGGFVSFHTLSARCIQALTAARPGAVICMYEWQQADVLPTSTSTSTSGSEGLSTSGSASDSTGKGVEEGNVQDSSSTSSTSGLRKDKKHIFLAVCWRSGTKCLNAMCSKVDIESMKHRLEALGVYRAKISAVKTVPPALSPPPQSSSTATAETEKAKTKGAETEKAETEKAGTGYEVVDMDELVVSEECEIVTDVATEQVM